jgi:TRAP-type C4-dicarboxylate transport system permease small subunit
MVVYGAQLCWVTKGNTIAEFPSLSTGIVYLPIPIGGLLTLLFIIEKIWLGEPPRGDVMYSDAPADLE